MTTARPRESLYYIETTLADLEQLRTEAEADGDAEAISVIDQQIVSYLSKAADKIDSYCALMRKLRDIDEDCSEEAQRLVDRAKQARGFRERLKELAMFAMNTIGVRVLESAKNRLRIQKNGGQAPLDVNADILPLAYKCVQVKIPAALWGEMLSQFADDPRMSRVKAGQAEPDFQLIRDHLALPEASIVGARLLERSEHLRLE